VRAPVRPALPACGLLLAGCTGPQSALETAGPTADLLAGLFWGMSIGSLVVWVAVVALAVYAVYFARRPWSARQVRLLVVGGGVALPSVVLTALLAHGLSLLPAMLAAAPPGSLVIHVTGHQWWWRVRYLRDGDVPVELANEIRLPVDRPIELRLDSADVIHTFWVPALAGKVDMIPGRRTRLLLRASRTGTFRGTCAEYCGTSHALMAFDVVVQEAAEFEQWLAREAQPAATPADPTRLRGEAAFLANGCGACHAVRGTTADGVVGPELTHVGSRLSLAAGTLRNGDSELRRWLAQTDTVKPSVHMPAFGMLPADEIAALAAYLQGLR
jgi:cytochrome c oxidase subunit 2